MPTYDYKCAKCGHRFEAFQSIKAEPLTECPKCKGAVQRIIGLGGGIIFKGSGFYETDYKRKPEPKTSCDSKGTKKECEGCPRSKENDK
ncbi:MAG: FmdB family zinc ribbon protein [Candidatus Omnitrophota bacterium]